MSQIEAIFQDGVFKPLSPVQLTENQRVRLSIQPVDLDYAHAWLQQIQHMHEEFIREHGYLPDSTPGIAEDRMRDV